MKNSTIIFLCFLGISALGVYFTEAQLADFELIQGNVIEIGNAHRPKGKMKITTAGATILNHTKANQGYQVVVNMSDKTQIIINRLSYMSIKDFAWYQIFWTGLSEKDLTREFCFHYGYNNASWYSTFENQKNWPMKSNEFLAKGKQFSTGDDFGSIVEYLFLNTDGFAILLNDWNQWFLRDDTTSATDPKMCVGANRPPGTPGHPIFRGSHSTYSMTFNVLTGKDIKSVHQMVFTKPGWLPTTKFHGEKNAIPDESMFKSPIWSTRVQYGKSIDQAKVLAFANDIKKHNLSVGQLEIDDQWEKYYGDLSFDVAKFSDSKKLVDDLHKLGFKVSLWVHPFVNSNSAAFKDNQKYFAKTKSDKKTASLKWSDSVGALIDFSNSSHSDWFVARLKKLQTDLKIDAYKFDAGEQSLYGLDIEYATPYVDQEKANLMSSRYAYAAYRLGHSVDVKSAFRSQGLPIFFRMSAKDSSWSAENGLRSLIRTALTLSIAGYSFILPDMIGGNALSAEHLTDTELYIRWVQASALLPAMHFSVAPWNFTTNTQTLTLAKKFIALHEEHASTIVTLANRVQNGEPLIRPMWYAAPDDARAYAIDDQFMLGDNIVVAPVLVKGATERSVYLPAGEWIDQHGKALAGNAIVKVAAPIEELPFFKRKQ